MRLEKRRYTLPPGDSSPASARIIEEWSAEREREELRQLIAKGGSEMRTEYEMIDRERGGAADEVWRDIRQSAA